MVKEICIDRICLQETPTNTKSQEQVEGYNFVCSTTGENKYREERLKRQGLGIRGRGRGQGKGARGTCKGKTDTRWLEHHGVGVVFALRIWRAIDDIEQKSSRIMVAKIQTNMANTRIMNTYCPQSRSTKEEKEKHDHDRTETYNECRRGIAPNILGDMNARLQGKFTGADNFLGEHTFGKKALQCSKVMPKGNRGQRGAPGLVHGHDISVTNTRFQQTPNAYCTYTELATEGFAAPRAPDIFQMMAHVIDQSKVEELNLRCPGISMHQPQH